jgi:hypothetical protein
LILPSDLHSTMNPNSALCASSAYRQQARQSPAT